MQQIQTLRVLIAIDATFTAIGVMTEPAWEQEIPAALMQAYREAFPIESAAGIAPIVLMLLIITLAGYIGMWKLKQWGRFAYTTACIVDVCCLAFYQPLLITGPAFALSLLTAFNGGALLAMVWLSDLRNQFK
jgi:hypothetical protein